MRDIPQRILMGPGPSDVPSRVLEALQRPTIGHLDPIFIQLMDGLQEKLRVIFCTHNALTLPMSGTGSAGMETIFVNLLEPGDKALICINGVFGMRMQDVAERCRAEVVPLKTEWGEVFDQDEIIAAVREHKPKLTAIVHAETSTGCCQEVDKVGPAVREAGGLFVLDCVTSLGGMAVEIDEWAVDAAYSGTQKCLSCPPGLAPVTFSSRAVEVMEQRKSKVQSWYLDLSMIRNYWGGDRAYHHTAPINMLYALDEAVNLVLEEGLKERWARHREMHELLKAGLGEMGIGYASPAKHTLPMLNAVKIPNGVDDAAVRRGLLEDYGLEIGAGLGKFKGQAWRIGLMGHSATKRNVALCLAALREQIA